MEIIGAAMFIFFKHVKGSNTLACYLIDFICLLSMFAIYKMNEKATSQSEYSKEPFMKCIYVA